LKKSRLSELKSKPETENKLETSLEKIFSSSLYHTFSEIAKILKKPCVIPKKMPQKITYASSFIQRDKIIRLLASQAYEIAEQFGNANDRKQQLKWMRLVAELLDLSLKPKQLADLEEIKRELAEIKKEQAAL